MIRNGLTDSRFAEFHTWTLADTFAKRSHRNALFSKSLYALNSF